MNSLGDRTRVDAFLGLRATVALVVVRFFIVVAGLTLALIFGACLIATTVVVTSSSGADASVTIGFLTGRAVPEEVARAEDQALTVCPDLPASLLGSLGFVASGSGRRLNGSPPWWSWPTGRFGVEPPTQTLSEDARQAVAILCLAVKGADSVHHALVGLLGDTHAVRTIEVVATALQDQPRLSAGRAQAIETASWALGLPYKWGGNGPDAYDCSGLMVAAWKSAGVQLPRTAQAQHDALNPSRGIVTSGDLLFFGSGSHGVTHVGIEIGAGLMVDAPYTGAFVRIEPDNASSAVSIGSVS